MKKSLPVSYSLPLLMAFSAAGFAADKGSLCKEQADQIISRLQTEVVGELDLDQRASANQIVIDVCQVREKQVEQATQQVRDEEQAKANAWLTDSADKPGNKRLKRKSH